MIISTSPNFINKNFLGESYVIRDSSLTSPNYFDITHFPDYIGGGKSLIKLRGNQANLLQGKLSEVEIIDAQGNPVAYEVPTYVDRFENYYISIHVYDTTAPGIATLSIVGVATSDLQGNPIDPTVVNDQGHNLIWTRSLKILPYERNNSELIFDDPPHVFVSQVVTPARISYTSNVETQYSAITASNLTIKTSDFKGFDRKVASSLVVKNGKVQATSKNKITDANIKNISVNADSQPFTVNSVNTTTRIGHRDVVGGFVLNQNNTYNTVLISTSSFFSASYIGATVAFFTNSYTLLPNTASNYDFSNTNPYDELVTPLPTTQSQAAQLSRWKSTIVNIKNDKVAYLDQPVQVNLKRIEQGNRLANNITHTYKDVTNFTASLLYAPDSLLYTTSSEVSQSYIQFTMQDLDPIGGEVYKIKVYYRRGSETGDWQPLQEQIVYPVEFLTDARFPNQTNYGADISDYYLLGHFVDQAVINDHWSTYNDRVTTFDTTTASLDNTVQLNSAKLVSSASINNIFTTRYFQNYPEKKVFSLTFNCTLDPYSELEIYQNSETLQTTVFGSDPFPRAFDKTLNYEPARYSDKYNRFGKLIGKIQNNTAIAKDYQRVVFDYKTDREGLGRPLFRVKQYNANTIANAYLSKISITPRQLNGFTPSTLEFAFPAKLDTNIYLDETIDYKLEYYDYTGNQSEYITYLENIVMALTQEIPTNACQAEQKTFNFVPYWWVNFSELSPPHAEIWAVENGIFSASFSNTTKWYPAFVNNQILKAIDINASVQANYYWAHQYISSSRAGSASLFSSPTVGWNCAVPTNGLYYTTDTTYTFQLVTSSVQTETSTGFQFDVYTDLGPVTSSWQYTDGFVVQYYSGGAFGGNATLTANAASVASASVSPIDLIPLITSMSCVGIHRANVSAAYAEFSSAVSDEERTHALKKRRLFYPLNSVDQQSFFTENGGIYNVKFKLKRYIPQGIMGSGQQNFSPDTGSYLSVFIFDVNTNFRNSGSGAPGWYPPPQNIVKIGNQYQVGGLTTPVISFTDSATGYRYDEYDINLVQYGSPAQLVFEPSAVGDSEFGIMIDDIQFCKIGVTTDPYYVRPQLLANSVITGRLPVGTTPPLDRSDR